MGFWIVAGAASIFVALAIWAGFLRPRGSDMPAAAYDLQVYRDQLKELERDVARGVLSEADATRVKAEVARRVLEADRALQASSGGTAATRGGPLVLGLGLVATIAGAFAVYWQIGAPGYPDLPLQTRVELVEEARASRPDQTEAETDVTVRPRIEPDPEREALVVQLRTVMERRPDDTQGLALLAQNEAALGNFRAARLAQGRLIDLLGAEATAAHYVDLAEMMVLAAGGYVSPEAEAALIAALEIEPGNGTARYYAGLMYAQQGRPDLAYPIWRNLLAESTPDAPWLEPIRLQIEEVAFLAGDPITLAELPQPSTSPRPGPTAEQIEAAGDMAPEDRMAMIEGMVSGLAERLSTEGGPPEDWARLIGAFVVLGRVEDAQAIYDEALELFAGQPEALAVLRPAGATLESALE
ncbi:c-type cytochrome biogenesis protein CcmI [Rhodophyticola porphyridii]|uniref:C-type cytochrome biogenesis protein CcmI n=1 Tax=Rhodophyticola porphyridii TaxID=1852017 RepID=A0A3L9Y4U2_9RHOB|nr:c-type cytochrome biogenesis protein CcmI [Rhodophyticola porphyridii]RMA41363.1 c-type cytochrome biogenesis protein CcmI [Rhodophyticola porphyridii]